MPGTAGGWIFVRDAIKKALPADVPQPGKFRMTNGHDTDAHAGDHADHEASNHETAPAADAAPEA